MRTGTANLPLHGGSAPRWLFERMVRLAREITAIVVADFGPEEMLRRLSDPFWFQAFGCVLGFDWHSSGVTTTVCGALKEAVKGAEPDFGICVAGGKGRVSRQTPAELASLGDRLSLNPASLIYASRMAAKVDNSALQDGYQLYHHTFIFVPNGPWAVIQQGMNGTSGWARRYHWLSSDLSDFVCEPHHAICSEGRGQVLNMVAAESGPAREVSAALAREKPEAVVAELNRLMRLDMPTRHHITLDDIHPERLSRTLVRTYEHQPRGFEDLLGLEGVGAKTIRALALISEIVYGVPASVRDPARFGFAHGGKDGHPFPVDRETYDRSIEVLREAVRRARLGQRERLDALRRLQRLV